MSESNAIKLIRPEYVRRLLDGWAAVRSSKLCKTFWHFHKGVWYAERHYVPWSVKEGTGK